MIESVRKIEDAGIPASVTFISGLAGKEGWEEHAIETGTMISEMNASYVGLLTLMLDFRAPITGQIDRGELTLLSGEEVVAETYPAAEARQPDPAVRIPQQPRFQLRFPAWQSAGG